MWTRLRKLTFIVGDKIAKRAIKKLRLPCLEEFKLQLNVSDHKNAVLLSALDMPRLESMDITLNRGRKIPVRGTEAMITQRYYEPILDADRRGGFCDLAEVIFGRDKEYPLLHTLAIRGIFSRERNKSRHNSAIDLICSRLRFFTTLRLNAAISSLLRRFLIIFLPYAPSHLWIPFS